MLLNLIYGLVDSRTFMVRYVGKSESGLKRPRQHSYANGRGHKQSWIKQLQTLGLTFEIVVLETAVSKVDLADRERWWIAYGRCLGWPLTNHTDGGEGTTGRKPSSETRAKMAASHRGKTISPETRAKISASEKATRAKFKHAKIDESAVPPSSADRKCR